MTPRDLCLAAGVTPPPDEPPRDWRFERQLPIIRGLLAMQREKLLRVYVDRGRVTVTMAGDNYRRELTWEQAGRMVTAWEGKQ